MSRKTKSHEDFLKKIIEKHGNIYDYSLVNYIGCKYNIKIICKVHGLFEQRADVHLSGRGCRYCNIKKHTDIRFKDKPINFLTKAKEKHGDLYDYSKVKYGGYNKKVIIICKTHGEFLQNPSCHIAGYGCSKCGYKIGNMKKTFTTKQALLKVKRIYKNQYLYNNFVYTGHLNKCKLTCKIHGDFSATYGRIINGTSCPKCRRTFGEIKVATWLDNNNIHYIEQYSNKTCTFKQCLRFDFFLPTFNIIIEYDGKQHFKEIKHFRESLESIQLKDNIKNIWAKENGYKMIRISYKHIKKIDQILEKELISIRP